jgi:flagellar biosynthesis/type III secretory pathway ATPase
MPDIVDAAHRRQADRFATDSPRRDSEDLVNVGTYVEGTNPRIDKARSKLDAIERCLCQDADTLCRYSDTVESLTCL